MAHPQICINILFFIHGESYHVATDKVPSIDGGKFRSIFSANLQPIATRGKKERDTLLVDKHCRNGCSIKRAPLSVNYYNKISGGHIGSSVVRRRGSAGPVLPLWAHHAASREVNNNAKQTGSKRNATFLSTSFVLLTKSFPGYLTPGNCYRRRLANIQHIRRHNFFCGWSPDLLNDFHPTLQRARSVLCSV